VAQISCDKATESEIQQVLLGKSSTMKTFPQVVFNQENPAAQQQDATRILIVEDNKLNLRVSSLDDTSANLLQ